MNNLNLFSAKELGNSGMQLAIEHAELKNDGWGDDALDQLKNFLKTRFSPFLCEEVRTYAETNGLPAAPSSRAWGAVIQRAKRESLIRHVGYGETTNPKAHGTPASKWVGVQQ